MSYETGQASALTEPQQQEIDDYEDFIRNNSNNIISESEINGEKCYEIGSTDESSETQSSETQRLWFEHE